MSADIQAVQMIPISQIRILNPRSRNKKIFDNVVSNISNLGLKRPITVAPRQEVTDGKCYLNYAIQLSRNGSFTRKHRD